ncbi:MAG: phytoene/squalene synthase family protein [Gaiellaceae bacterium]
MSSRELTAAGITAPDLRVSYEACRRLNAAHGKTYYLATLLLPPEKRPYVHALYGFARYADEIVDDLDATMTAAEKAAELAAWSDRFGSREGDDGVLPAIFDTIDQWELPPSYFEAFLDSMRMDLTVVEYKSYDDLMTYMYGSAAVIGLQMVPVLGHPGVPRAVVEPYAADLGIAFQLANFIRDVGEDLRRGRIYLPVEDLEHFGVDRPCLERGVVTGAIRRLLAYEIARAREIFRSAKPGIRLLHPASRGCVQTAFTLYGRILDEVERADYQVLDRRVSVGLQRRVMVVAPALLRAVMAARPGGPTRSTSTT